MIPVHSLLQAFHLLRFVLPEGQGRRLAQQLTELKLALAAVLRRLVVASTLREKLLLELPERSPLASLLFFQSFEMLEGLLFFGLEGLSTKPTHRNRNKQQRIIQQNKH